MTVPRRKRTHKRKTSGRKYTHQVNLLLTREQALMLQAAIENSGEPKQAWGAYVRTVLIAWLSLHPTNQPPTGDQ